MCFVHVICGVWEWFCQIDLQMLRTSLRGSFLEAFRREWITVSDLQTRKNDKINPFTLSILFSYCHVIFRCSIYLHVFCHMCFICFCILGEIFENGLVYTRCLLQSHSNPCADDVTCPNLPTIPAVGNVICPPPSLTQHWSGPDPGLWIQDHKYCHFNGSFFES